MDIGHLPSVRAALKELYVLKGGGGGYQPKYLGSFDFELAVE